MKLIYKAIIEDEDTGEVKARIFAYSLESLQEQMRKLEHAESILLDMDAQEVEDHEEQDSEEMNFLAEKQAEEALETIRGL